MSYTLVEAAFAVIFAASLLTFASAFGAVLTFALVATFGVVLLTFALVASFGVVLLTFVLATTFGVIFTLLFEA